MKTRHARLLRYQILAAREDVTKNWDTEGRRRTAGLGIRYPYYLVPEAYWRTWLYEIEKRGLALDALLVRALR